MSDFVISVYTIRVTHGSQVLRAADGPTRPQIGSSPGPPGRGMAQQLEVVLDTCEYPENQAPDARLGRIWAQQKILVHSYASRTETDDEEVKRVSVNGTPVKRREGFR